MALGRQPFRCGSELDVVSAARDDAFAGCDAALNADEIAVASGDVDEPARELLAAGLYEYVRSSGFHQHGRLRDGGPAGRVSCVEDGSASLTNQQASAGVVYL